jgi:hypothetical protein
MTNDRQAFLAAFFLLPNWVNTDDTSIQSLFFLSHDRAVAAPGVPVQFSHRGNDARPDGIEMDLANKG